MPRIDVNLPANSYSITIEHGLLAHVGTMAAGVIRSRRAMLVVDAAIAKNHGGAVERSLRQAGFEVTMHHVRATEADKSLETAQAVYHAMLNARMDRSSCLIAMGGGIVGDVAGFAAATYMRGVALIHVPTTLLAMVDAAIGGKTGVNLRLPDGALGKNLIGAFWQPTAVFADPEALRTLESRQFRCGLAECVKHGMIADGDLLRFIADNARAILSLDMNLVTELIARSVRIKASIVEQDERESDRRMLLNLGHTFAHAIEAQEELALPHGEAVALGLHAAVRCALNLGKIAKSDADQVRTLLHDVGLPKALPHAVSPERLLAAMAHDKKSSGGNIRLVLPVGLGSAGVFDSVPSAVIADALQEIGART